MLKTSKSSLFISILILSIGLFFHHLSQPGFFHDGYLYAALGRSFSEGKWLLVPSLSETVYKVFDQHPPFYFMLEGLFFEVFGWDWASARFFTAFWAFLITLSIFIILAKKNIQWAFFSSLLFVTNLQVLKHARFPNIDFILALFYLWSVYFFYRAWNVSKNKYWFGFAISAGLAILFKGLSAIFIYTGLGLFFIIENQWRKSIKTIIFVCFSLSFILIWPILLKFGGNNDVFTNYLNAQLFGTVVDGRGQQKNDYFLYLKHIAIYNPITLALLIISIWKMKFLKNEKSSKILIVFTTSTIVLMSCMKFKYGHYLIPMYSFIAIIAGYALSKFELNKSLARIKISACIIAVVVCLIPTTSKRSPELLSVEQSIITKKIPATYWTNMNDDMSDWGLINFIAYRFSASLVYKNSNKTQIFVSNEKENNMILLFKSENTNYFYNNSYAR